MSQHDEYNINSTINHNHQFKNDIIRHLKLEALDLIEFNDNYDNIHPHDPIYSKSTNHYDNKDEQYIRIHKKLNQVLDNNLQYQESLISMLEKINKKIEDNNEKLGMINSFRLLDNPKAKKEMKKKKFGFYEYDKQRSLPTGLKILETIRNAKPKKRFSNMLKNLICESDESDIENKDDIGDIDSDNDDNEDEEEEEEEEDMKSINNNNKQIMKMKNFSENRLEVKEILENIRNQDPQAIDWIVLARKANLALVNQKADLVTGLELFQKFMEPILKKTKSKWTTEEDGRLRQSVMVYGTSNWKQVASNIDGKDTYQCFQRWHKYANPSIKKGRWSYEEDIRLVLAVEFYKSGNWIMISNHLEHRTDVQCRERWCNILEPSLNNEQWTKAEDEALKNLVHKIGPKWSLIAKHLKVRTDNQCWRRWKLIKSSKNVFTIHRIKKKNQNQ